MSEFKKYRNALTTDLRKAKGHYYQNLFECVYNNPRRIWEAANSITSRKKASDKITQLVVNGETLSGEGLANAINTHFVDAGSYNTNVNVCDGTMPMEATLSQSVFLRPTDSIEIANLINKLKNNVTPGVDELGSNEIKLISPLICEALSYIINLTLTTGVFPKQLKIAKVTAVYKGGDVNALSNCRPISVLPAISKIFESIIYDRLVSFFERHQVITQCQYGFRKHRSTKQALVHIKDKIIENMESRKYTLGLFLDIQKAFDSIQFDLLHHKL